METARETDREQQQQPRRRGAEERTLDPCYERPHKVDDDESSEMKKEPAGRRLTDRETDNVNASRGSTTLITAAQTVVKGKSEQQLFQCERSGLGMGLLTFSSSSLESFVSHKFIHLCQHALLTRGRKKCREKGVGQERDGERGREGGSEGERGRERAERGQLQAFNNQLWPNKVSQALSASAAT